MNKRVIHPPVADHDKLRQGLTIGEQEVLEFFDRYLPVSWEIYIQPHLNGLRPDFVLLNPHGGIAVFEVKDWNLNAMRYFTQKDRWGHTGLWAKKDGKEFCIQSSNPVTKVNLYKKEIFDLYCPRLQMRAGWAAITAGVIFPFAQTDQVKGLLAPFLKATEGDRYARYQPISGIEEIAAGDLEAIFPEANRSGSRLMAEGLAEDLRSWLAEPDFSSMQRTPLLLDRNQRSLANTRTDTGYRRIKGPAGSGKSLVLAARAAPEKLKNIQFTHFHLWCKHVCYDVGWEHRYDELWNSVESNGQREDVLNVALPRLAEEAVEHSGAKRYDAILVDEGQDYRPLWWNVLRKACDRDGEMLLVADATQDVYGTARSWTDEVMKGAGFSGGRWAQLNVSYRLPPDALSLVRSFAEGFLPQEAIDLPEPEQRSLDLYPCHLRWVQCGAEGAEKICSDEILSLMRQTGKANLANADITMLASDMKSGGGVVARLSEYRVRAVNTFGVDHRRRKMGFYMGDARIKATTLHSFKGWETRLLVVYVTEAAHEQSLALIYAGLTRLKRSQEGSWLTVVCSAPQLQAYGQTFADHVAMTDTASV